MRSLTPDGASGVLSKSNMPCRWAYADIYGHVLEVRKRFNIMKACGSNSSHKYMGNFWCTDASPATRWFLNERIACSAALTRCVCGSTNCQFTSVLFMNLVTAVDALLSKMFNLGLQFRAFRYIYMSSYTRRASSITGHKYVMVLYHCDSNGIIFFQ